MDIDQGALSTLMSAATDGNLEDIAEDYIETWSEDIWFETRDSDNLYAQSEGLIADNVVQRCFAGMPFGKDAETAAFLEGEYDVILGAAIWDLDANEGNGGLKVNFPHNDTLTLDLKAPKYENENLLEELEEEENEYFE